MLRENLTAYPAGEQFAIDLFERTSLLTPETAWATGAVYQADRRIIFSITNKELFNRFRWMEFLNALSGINKEFPSDESLASLFHEQGVDIRHGDILELYVENPDFHNNYRLQVDLDRENPYLIRILAYAKDVPHRHRAKH